MPSHAAGDNTRNGYADNNETHDGDTANTTPAHRRITGKRRRTPATMTDVRVGRIETVTMTAAEETEAVTALAVLVAHYWRTHPEQAG